MKSVIKRHRQSIKLRARNRSETSRMRTFAKKVLQAVEAPTPNLEDAQAKLREAISVLAVTGRKKIIHKNQASRRISRLNAKVKALALSQAAA
ncbi:MAG: 30S ribosomal protein S20 [Magnetococcales bacterium]|nr:30S ribosomal protein S20 [Magnetococcales bacterium]